jgi:hypothetical protein
MSALRFLLVLLAATAARAQPDAEEVQVERRALIDGALAAAERGDHARAVALAERAASLGTTPSLLRFLAEERLAIGARAAAHRAASACALEAAASERRSDVPHRRACEALVRRLTPDVGLLRITVEDELPGLEIVAGRVVVEPAARAAFAVEPGGVDVVATAPGRAPFERSLTVAAGSTLDVPVVLAPAVAEPEPPPDPDPVIDPAPARSSAPPVVPAPPDAGRPGAWAALSLGAATAATGAVVFALRRPALDDAADACGVERISRCDEAPTLDAHQQGRRAYDRARRRTIAGSVLAGAGTAAAAAAVVRLVAGAGEETGPEARRAGPVEVLVVGGGVMAGFRCEL